MKRGRPPGKRTRVAEVLVNATSPRSRVPQRAVVRLECGHVAFRQYAQSVGRVAYCAQCAQVTP